MMLQAEVRHVIAQRVKKVIIAVVVGTEKFLRLIDQALVLVPHLLRGFERGGAVGGNIHFGEWILRERNDFEKFSGDDWRINQGGKRDRREFNFVSALACDGKRRA